MQQTDLDTGSTKQNQAILSQKSIYWSGVHA
jgi:hypothetical protein